MLNTVAVLLAGCTCLMAGLWLMLRYGRREG
jgi:hypothetical protein